MTRTEYEHDRLRARHERRKLRRGRRNRLRPVQPSNRRGSRATAPVQPSNRRGSRATAPVQPSNRRRRHRPSPVVVTLLCAPFVAVVYLLVAGAL